MRRNEETRQYTNSNNTNDNTENVLLQAYIYNIHSNKSIFRTNDNEPT